MATTYSPLGLQLAATRPGTGPPQVLTKNIGAQGAIGRSQRVGSVHQAYQRPVRTARRKVQGPGAIAACDHLNSVDLPGGIPSPVWMSFLNL